MSDATSLVLNGAGELFSAVHHFRGDRIAVTVQSFDAPEIPLARVDAAGWQPSSSGDPAVWRDLPEAYVGYLNDRATGAAGYYLITVGAHPTVARLDWFDDDSYDHDYQSVTAVATVPETGERLFGVQRSSHLIVCSPDGVRVVQAVVLTGHGGNPVPYVRGNAPEIWAIDYDTVVRVDRRTWRVTGDAFLTARQGFLGDLAWSTNEQQVIVPRPYLGDVLLLDPTTLGVMQTIQTGRQPLQAALLDSGYIVARDWKTGDILFGS